jgi:hypothetical protein
MVAVRKKRGASIMGLKNYKEVIDDHESIKAML